MAGTDTPILRPLAVSDIADLMALVEEAGWNQTEADWARMLTLGDGRGIADADGRIVASAVTMGYGGGIGWIGMVLVAGAWRRQGLATRLMEASVAGLQAAGLTPGLDATPDGEAVYGAMGFAGTERLTRWRRPARTSTLQAPVLPRVSPADLGWITNLDATAFGARRRYLIAGYMSCGAAGGWKIGEQAVLLERPGRTARHLGPLSAADEAQAATLVEAAASSREEALLIDVPDRHRALSALLEASGFVPERPFLRMYLGRSRPAGRPELLMASAGPEIG